MTTRKLSTRGAETRRAITDHENFTTYGALSGRWGLDSFGALSKDHRVLASSHRSTGDIYVVYSYATPIGWWTQTHGWIRPDARYSVTTSRHQGMIPACLASVAA